MRLMVLGAGGFVGGAVMRRAVEQGWTVAAVTRASTDPERLAPLAGAVTRLHAELTDAVDLRRVVADWRPDAIVQAAFPTGHGAAGANSQRAFFDTGAAPALALSEALQEPGYRGVLVHAGSAMSFGAGARPHAAGDRLAPNTRRGLVKACCGLIYEQAARAAGFRLCELFIYTVYGPWEQRGRLIPELARAALCGETIRMTPAGHLRNWVYADDVADACLDACRRTPAGVSRVVVGSGSVVSTHEVAREMEAITGRRLVGDCTLPVSDRYGDEMLEVDPAPGLATVGWAPQVALPEGLRRLWRWAETPEGRRYLLRG